jgi:hypothetical protein
MKKKISLNNIKPETQSVWGGMAGTVSGNRSALVFIFTAYRPDII